MARWSDEIGTDAEINLKKLGQLAIHCRRFFTKTAGLDPQVVTAARLRLNADGLTWASEGAMQTDLAALRSDGNALYNYVKTNMLAEVQAAGGIGYDPDQDGGQEAANTLPKPHAVEPFVAAVRANFV